MKNSNLKYTYLNPVRDQHFMKQYNNSIEFSKVRALNYGIKHVGSSNSIVFILDLHLQLPLNMFDRIRKVRIQKLVNKAWHPSKCLDPISVHFHCTSRDKKTMGWRLGRRYLISRALVPKTQKWKSFSQSKKTRVILSL